MTEIKRALAADEGVSASLGPPVPDNSPAVIAVTSAPGVGPLPPPPPVKKLCDAYLLCFPLGLLGAHNYYLRRYGFGLVYTFTLGLLGVGMVVDMIRMPCLVKRVNKRIRAPESVPRKSLSDAYVLWFPFGLLGFHHFYLRRWAWGIAYFLSLGMLGVGWLLDGCRMKVLVDEANKKLSKRMDPQPNGLEETEDPRRKSVSDAYVLCLSPISGLLGIHNYYLGRIGFGLFYTFTLGSFGIGWLIDCFRLSCLAKRVNKQRIEGSDGLKHLDDAYVCLFPFGLLGFHHYYLGRYGWGLLYNVTLGCFGIGWIVDWFRLPCLVRSVNEEILLKRATSGDRTVVVTDEHMSINHQQGVQPGAGYGTPSLQVPSYEFVNNDLPPSYIDVTQSQMPYQHMPQPGMPHAGMPMPPHGMPMPQPGMPWPHSAAGMVPGYPGQFPYPPPEGQQAGVHNQNNSSSRENVYDNAVNASLEKSQEKTDLTR